MKCKTLVEFHLVTQLGGPACNSARCWVNGHECSHAWHADKGSWVRVRTQLYKGDLAKVVDIELARGQA